MEWLTTMFHSNQGDIPFDIFSAVFYLISRYEEYLEGTLDKHQRFKAENSILSSLGLLETPIIDKWLYMLFRELQIKPERKYKYLSTIDIDNAYAYQYKSLALKIGGSLKALLRKDYEDVKRRLRVYFRGAKDPYNTYDYMEDIHKNSGVETHFFFLVSDRNEWDRNLPFTNKHYRALIQALQRQNKCGIHPGYHSFLNQKVTREEKLRLEDILGESVLNSRQHFLKIKFPETPQNLCDIGVKNDYTLGYPETVGYRAGTCTPFYFYNLEEEKATDLKFHSSAVMDTTLNNYMKLSPDEAIEKLDSLIKEVKEMDGELISIWHNETLSDIREWKGWKPVFEKLISTAKSN